MQTGHRLVAGSSSSWIKIVSWLRVEQTQARVMTMSLYTCVQWSGQCQARQGCHVASQTSTKDFSCKAHLYTLYYVNPALCQCHVILNRILLVGGLHFDCLVKLQILKTSFIFFKTSKVWIPKLSPGNVIVMWRSLIMDYVSDEINSVDHHLLSVYLINWKT